MNVKTDKPIADFTEKQRKAFRACMKKISRTGHYTTSKNNLVKAIRESGAYERKNDAANALKMILKNPNTPLELGKNGYVERTDIN